MGLATAQLLSSRGAIISLADINQEGLQAAVQSLKSSDRHMFTVVDVRSSQSVDAWITSTVQKFGRLDGAVNMAGVITPATPITEVTDDNWNFSFDVNARGVFYCVRAQLRAMGDGASIVSWLLSQNGSLCHDDVYPGPRNNTSSHICQVSAASTFGQFGAVGNVAYCASKAAVIGLTRTAAKENQKIRVNCVSPGELTRPRVYSKRAPAG